MDYSDANLTLSDSLSGYITANEDECDNSRYLSVLSQDLTLQEMNVTLSNDQIEEHNVAGLLSTEETNEPFIFTVDGTNEIYGVQLGEDEDGNLQKYQIQYSENINGELVPLLETIQLLPLDYEEQMVASQGNCSSNDVLQSNDNFVIRNEEFISHNSGDDVNSTKNNEMADEDINENIEELSIISNNETSFKMQIKKEPEELFDRSSQLGTAKQNIVETQNLMEVPPVRPKVEEFSNDILEMEDNENNMIDIQHYLQEEELYEETIEEKHFEQLFLEENHIVDANRLIINENVEENNQQKEFYHILDSVTDDTENIYDQGMHTILKETTDHHPKTNILKKPIHKSLLKDFINSEPKILYVQTFPEKENLTVMDIESFTKPNSRSLLKCNQPPQVLKETDHLTAEDGCAQQKLCTTTVSRTKETKPLDVYCRTKQAKEARQFMNFINSTTIPQVPERKGRLPRKQQIKPVKHPDEDIVVKEMIVSSNGFVEPISAEERKYLPVTEYVELLDSGDEMCNDNMKKKRSNEKNKLIEIEISDTDDSDIGVVEMETTENKKSGNEAKTTIKGKRGRPPKSKTSSHEKKDSYPNSPPKISRLDSDVESVTSTLQVIRMGTDVKNDFADKAESEKNSAKNVNVAQESTKSVCSKAGSTNIQKNSISEKLDFDVQSRVNPIPDETTSKKVFEYKYECEKCKMKFINKFLQSRHNCVSKTILICDICQQKFSTSANLNLHKKSHAKAPPTIKPNTTKPNQSKEVTMKDKAPNSCLGKSSVSASRISMVSKAPGKIPTRQSILPSKITKPSFTYNKSTRMSTVPIKSKQLVPPVKNSMQLPKGSTLPIKSNNSNEFSQNTIAPVGPIKENTLKPPTIKLTPNKASNSSIYKCEKQCNHCSMKFDNHALWFDHQVLKHGLKTPDKTIGEKKLKKIVKEKVVHNGIRSAPSVAKNFSMLKDIVHNIK